MSYHITAVGRPIAVGASVVKQVESYGASMPVREKTLLTAVVEALSAELLQFPPDQPVRLTLTGSQGSAYVNGKTVDGSVVNSMNVQLEPLYGFVDG